MWHFKNKEILICTLIWSLAVFYSIFCFTGQSSKYFSVYKDDYNDFEPGFFMDTQTDVADLEWQTMIFLLKKIWIWICAMLFFSELLRKKGYYQILKFYQIGISVIFILLNLGPIALIAIMVQPILFKIIKKLNKAKSTLWVVNIMFIFIISCYKYKVSSESFKIIFRYNEKELYLHILAVYWTNLRSFSFFMEQDETFEEVSNLDLLSYCLYLPVLFNGPFLFYTDFKNMQIESFSLRYRLLHLTENLTRFLFWMIFIEFTLHFVYVNATSYQVQLVESFDGWALYGYGYLMGQYFHMKYLVVYGLSTSVAKFENIPVPSLPKCIGRIHLYSDMWKYFDNGLYKFLVRYIYVPTMNSSFMSNKFVSSLLCFTFVYIWHGLDNYIFIWALLNLFGIFIENTSALFYKTYLKDLETTNYFGTSAMRRITCFLASFLLAMSAVSNFYFFAGVNIGTIFVTRFLEGTFTSNAILILALYCCCQISTELRNMTSHQTKEKKT